MRNNRIATYVYNVFILLFLAVGFNFVFAACSKDEPDIPVDETGDKGHDEPVKAEFILAEGHLHGIYSFHQNKEIEGVTYLKKVQTLTYEQTLQGWEITSPVKQFNVQSDEMHDENIVYGLWINYYNNEGELMNGGFMEGGMDRIHQHFFIPKEVTAAFDGTEDYTGIAPTDVLRYIYCDTDPWNETMHSGKGKLTGDKSPVGFKGYFVFKKNHVRFELNIRLMHARMSKFDESGNASPFYAPGRSQLQNDHWDIAVKIPVIVYADRLEDVSGITPDTPESEWSVGQKKTIEAMSKAYGVSPKEVVEDLERMIEGDVSPEDGQLWL